MCILPPTYLTLSLLMLGVLANDTDAALALNDFAFFADGLDRRSHFHGQFSFIAWRRFFSERNY